MKKNILLGLLLMMLCAPVFGSYILIPMDDEGQKEHLKAYGLTYWVLTQGIEADWLLNYRGGSFCIKDMPAIQSECKIRGVSYEIIADAAYSKILADIADPGVNMDMVKLQKPPRVAVYSPKSKLPWDDAVTLVLTYAEIPYDVIYDEEVMTDALAKYDWLHLHHEDFTGQYGRFYSSFKNTEWYKNDVKANEEMAKKLGFSKVSEMKLGVAKKIKEFVAGGGFLFAMCSATDSYDIALDSDGLDVCEHMYDGDGTTPQYWTKLDYSKGFAFKDYKISTNPLEYEFSNIDNTSTRNVPKTQDYFTLFEFSAKWDPVPSMLCQNHTTTVKGFMGQTTAFNKNYIKSSVLIMGETKAANEARYIHGELGKGTWSFLGGHDPEDYQHLVGDPVTELALHPNSPGYRLILNNILFPAAQKKKQKT